MYNPTPVRKFIAYELGSILNPDSWAAKFKKKGARQTKLEDVEHRRCNRHAINAEIKKDPTGIRLHSVNSYLVIELGGSAFKGGQALPAVLEKNNEDGRLVYFAFKILRPIEIYSPTSYLCETSEGKAKVSITKDFEVKVEKV